MIKSFWLAVLYLAVSVALEFALLDLFNAGGGAWTALFDWRMLAMGGILWGLAAGEGAGMAMALAAALCYGLAQSAGKFGASLVSFTLAAWLAGVLRAQMRPQSFVTRGLWIFALLTLERIVWSLIRVGLRMDAAFDLPWVGLAATAIIGAALLQRTKR